MTTPTATSVPSHDHPSRTTPRPTRRRSIRVCAVVATGVLLGSLAPLTPHQAEAASAAPRAEWTTQNTEFVTRDASRLQLGGETFRASGANIYWLGLDENVGGVDYPTFFRIKDTLDSAHRAGITVVRSHMGTSTAQDDANTLALMPSLGEYDDDAFATIDFAVAYAGSLGMRLILPLTDEWEYYHGGHRDFTTPLGLESADFYTDPRAIDAYQDYVDHVVGRTNALTGVPYAEDPTIMAWELGNELEGMTLPWIDEQVAHIKRQAPSQLVAAGRRFDIDPDTLAATALDIVDVHYYPPTAARVSADAATVTAAGKVYIAGEYASTAATPALLSPLAQDPAVSGMFVWSLFGHDDRAGLVPHDDGFTFNLPGGTPSEESRAEAIRQYARDIGVVLPALPLETPIVTSVQRAQGISTITWRGTAGAAGYVVERQVDDQPWTTVTEEALGASAGTVTDIESPAGASYRVRALDGAGTTGPASDVVHPDGGDVLVDPVQDWRLSSEHDGVTVAADPDGGSVIATDGTSGTVAWQHAGLTRAEFQVDEPGAARIETSADGSTWVPAATVVTDEGSVVADGLADDHVRVVLTGDAHLTRATLRSAAVDPTTAPGAFSLQAPLDETTGTTSTPDFAWTAATDAAYYRFALTNAEGTVVASADGLTGTSYRPDVTLVPGTTYRWSVEAVNGVGTTTSVPTTASFATRPLPTEALGVEDFEEYADDAALTSTYVRNTGGGAVTSTLGENPSTGSQAGQFAYDLAGPGYAGVVRTLAEPQDWWGYTGLSLSLRAPAGDDVTVQIVAGGSYFETTLAVEGEGWQQIDVPFSAFAPPAWAGDAVLDPSTVTQLAFYLGGDGAGELLVDDVVTMVDPAAVVPADPGTPSTPGTPGSGAGPAGPESGAGGAVPVSGTGTVPASATTASTGLAFTGSTSTTALALAALASVIAGAVALRAARRRRLASTTTSVVERGEAS
nr:carbohydrate binding domain-containing protein [Frigoribacterium sp. CFBP 8766]